MEDVEFGVGISKIAVVTMETMQKGQNFEFSQNILEHQCLIYSRDIKWYMNVYDYGRKKLQHVKNGRRYHGNSKNTKNFKMLQIY